MFMTMDEISVKYDGQWVYVVNLVEDENGKVIGGEVEAHDKSRKKVSQAMLDSENDSIYIFYVGEAPQGVGILFYNNAVNAV